MTGSGAGPYTVTVSPGDTLPLRGLIGGGEAFSATCPANEMVVGFGGRAAAAVDQLVLQCAPIEVQEVPDAFIGVIGDITETAPVGGLGGFAFDEVDCDNTLLVATVARIRAGDIVDAFGLGCQQPKLRTPECESDGMCDPTEVCADRLCEP